MKIIVVTAPDHDFVTETISKHVKEIIDLDDDELDVTLIESDDVSIKKFQSEVESKGPGLILLNGHGSTDELYGHDNEVLISTTHNDLDRYKDKIVHALACDAAVNLGPQMINVGTKSFIGYLEPFAFCVHKNDDGSFIDDGLPSMFINPAKEVMISLIEGKTSQESYDKSQKAYAQSIKDVYTSNDPAITQDKQIILSYLLQDYRGQTLLGDASATFS